MSVRTPYEEIVNVPAIGNLKPTNLHVIAERASQEARRPSGRLSRATLVLGIDFQHSFMERGELGVPGAHGDVERFTRFVYEHLEDITTIAVSLDTHSPRQIFHPCWWVNAEGQHPEPFTLIRLADLEAGTWIPLFEAEASRAYVSHLEREAKRTLCIWPYHCLEGTTGAALETQLANLLYFYAVFSGRDIVCLPKGKNPTTEMYGIFQEEGQSDQYAHTDFLSSLANYDSILVAGEAKSHCVLESLRQILTFYANKRDVTSRIYVLEDCMSVIPGYEEETEAQFASWEREYGIHRIHSTSWPVPSDRL